MATLLKTIALTSLVAGIAFTGACSQEPESATENMPVLTTGERPQLGHLLLESLMTFETISAFFPSLKVTSSQAMSEGMAYPVLQVSTPAQEPLFVIAATPEYPAEGWVKIVGAAIKLDNGAAVGESFSNLSATFIYEKCLPGVEEQSGKIYCPLQANPTISYLFGGTYNGPDGEVPPKEMLQNFTVRAIIWARS